MCELCVESVYVVCVWVGMCVMRDGLTSLSDGNHHSGDQSDCHFLPIKLTMTVVATHRPTDQSYFSMDRQ